MDARKLLEILSDGRWHSPGDLQEALSNDASLLQRWLAQFQDYGLEVQRNAEGQVSLPHPLSLLERQRILKGLEPAFRDSLSHFELPLVVDSTNTNAMEWLRKGNKGRAVFLAEQQTSGRGRRGRSWISPMARNLTMSLVWPVTEIGQVQQGFSLVVALSLVDAIRSIGLQGSELLRVKWPNDVWLGDAKLAGILLELHGATSSSPHVVIGIGVNVHMPEQQRAGIDQPVSDLHSQGNQSLDRNQLVVAILSKLERNLQSLHADGFENFRQLWHGLEIYQNRQVEIVGHGQRTIGVVRGVSSNGELILETKEGERHFAGGEIAPTVRPLQQSAGLIPQIP